MFGGELRKRGEVTDTSWYFDLNGRQLTIKVGSLIEVSGGDVFEVGYVEGYEVVTTQNHRYHVQEIVSILDKDLLDALEYSLPTMAEEPTIAPWEKVSDAVNHPSHYTKGKFEVIEVIEEWTKHYDDGYTAYCVGNTMKYVSRAPHKHSSPLEDLKKARAYLDFAIAYEEAK